jgi:hypothetical protein
MKDLYVNVSNSLSIYKVGNVEQILNQFRQYHSAGYWDNLDNLYNEAKKYDSYQDFYEFSRVAFEKMRELKILHEVFPNFVYKAPVRKITKELIIQVLESGKYKNITQLAKNEPTIYLNVKDNEEWLDKYFPNRKIFERHTEEDIRNIAKQCRNRNDMEIRFRGAMHKARSKYPHILDEIFGEKYTIRKKNPSK